MAIPISSAKEHSNYRFVWNFWKNEYPIHVRYNNRWIVIVKNLFVLDVVRANLRIVILHIHSTLFKFRTQIFTQPWNEQFLLFCTNHWIISFYWRPVAVPHPVPYPVHHVITKYILHTHELRICYYYSFILFIFFENIDQPHWYFRKITVPYPVPVPAPSVSYSAPVVVGHGSYDHSYGSYGHGIYSSSYKAPYYSSSGIKVITASPSYKSYYHGGYHGDYHGGYHSHHGGYHSHYGGGLGISVGSKYGWPLKFGLKYHGWW